MRTAWTGCTATAAKPHASALYAGERFREATQPVFDSLYELVEAGEETRIVLEKSKAPDYRQKLPDELNAMGDSEMWRAGTTVRSLVLANKRSQNKLLLPFWFLKSILLH